MISPYGLRMAKFDDTQFADQISKLKVDIIAYQDEIGCVVEPMPMSHMKENFRHLREVHDKTKIELWANNEYFTWEKGLNTRPSAFIPAPFPRFLSQLTGVSKAGVDEVISFAICGILDKPGSEIPIGQPVYAAKAYNEYMDWKEGKGRWPLLAASFYGDLKHDAISRSAVFISPPSEYFSSGNITDGKLGTEDYTDKNWLGFEKKDMIATIDMGENFPVKINCCTIPYVISKRIYSCRQALNFQFLMMAKISGLLKLYQWIRYCMTGMIAGLTLQSQLTWLKMQDISESMPLMV